MDDNNSVVNQQISDLFEYAKEINKTVNDIIPVVNSLTNQVNIIKRRQSLLGPMDFLHINTVEYNNIGDYVLSNVVQNTIATCLGKRLLWASYPVNAKFGLFEARSANNAKAVIVGGGGLIFKQHDGQPHSWQWNLDIEDAKEIKVPIFLFAIGYNQFRNQEDLDDNFVYEINELAKQCGFIGLRNYGSIDAMKRYLSEDNFMKVVYQPCPTTIISKLYDVSKYEPEEDFIAINMAFDRPELRFGSDENANKVLNGTLAVVSQLSKQYKIKYYAHFEADNLFCKYMDQFGIEYEYVPLYLTRDMEYQLKMYSIPKLVIGMRGHAQMIPFGCGVPIVSIVSHDKMQFFLDDIGHPEWGVDVMDEDYANRLYVSAVSVLEHHDEICEDILQIQDKLYQITKENVDIIRNITQ